MNSILSIGKSGLKAMQNKMDSIADDIANVDTSAYKRKEIQFQELLLNEISGNEVLLSDNTAPAGINAGSKSMIATINFEQGPIKESSGELDMAINGEGFFGVKDKNGNLLLTRNGAFHINENYTITDDDGYILEADIHIPVSEWGDGDVHISAEGNIFNTIDGESRQVGRVILYKPEVLDLLIPLGENRYLPSSDVVLSSSEESTEGFGKIIQHALEGSNVELSKSIADMIITQRAYSMNGKAIQTTDDIMSIINNIKQ